ncbi:DMT family transporter [Streptomyces sp. TR06-5]|uniref:DMT family transporter n=1 Tax=Streptomyces sp. TR06-5 TaxID=3385976 RepID=UPI00399F393F
MHLAGVAAGSVVSLGSAPIASAVIERIVDGRRFTRRWTTGAVLGVSGTVLLTLAQAARTHPGEGSRSAGDAVLGLSLALVAGVSYALYSWTARRLLKGGTTPPATMGALFGFGGVLLLPLLVIVGDPLVESWPNAAVGTYMALVPMFLGYTLFGRGLAHVPASTATTLSLLEPAVAAVLAVLVVGERLSPPGWGGITLLLGALAVLTAPPRRSTDAHTVAVPDPVTPDRLPPPAQAPREPANLGHTKTDHLPVDGFPRRGREAGT